jgi:hypothetical protein
MDDLPHEGIVEGGAAPKSIQLPVKEPEQAREMDVLGMP